MTGHEAKGEVMKLIKLLRVLVVPLVAVTLPGCSVWELRWGKDKPPISYVVLPDKEAGVQVDKLYSWRPDSSVAYVFMDQKHGTHPACIASADVAKSTTTNDALALSLGKLIGSKGDVQVSAAQSVEEQLTLLTNKGAAGAFLNVALFHICLINGTGQLDHAEVVQLVMHAIDTAAKIASTPAPALGDQPLPKPPTDAHAEVNGTTASAGGGSASATTPTQEGPAPSSTAAPTPQPANKPATNGHHP